MALLWSLDCCSYLLFIKYVHWLENTATTTTRSSIRETVRQTRLQSHHVVRYLYCKLPCRYSHNLDFLGKFRGVCHGSSNVDSVSNFISLVSVSMLFPVLFFMYFVVNLNFVVLLFLMCSHCISHLFPLPSLPGVYLLPPLVLCCSLLQFCVLHCSVSLDS